MIYIPNNKKSETLSNNNNNNTTLNNPNGNHNYSTKTNKMPSVPTSPMTMFMPCPTPIHSPAPVTTTTTTTTSTATNQRQFSANESTRFSFDTPKIEKMQANETNTSARIDDKDSNNIVKKLSTTAKLQTARNGLPSRISTIITPPTPAALTKNSSVTQKLSRAMPRITRETIRDLPPIPKFKKHFPIVRRNTSTHSNVIVPKFMSLEIFNPETDDLDSDLDSSDGDDDDEDEDDASSPDSIDSVINALQSQSTNSPTEPLLKNESADTKSIAHDQGISSSSSSSSTNNNSNSKITEAPLVEAAAVVAKKLEDTVEMIIHKQEISSTITTTTTTTMPIDSDDQPTCNIIINKNDINLNHTVKKVNSTTSNNNNNIHINNNHHNSDKSSDNLENCREHLVEFAEKLSAQLLKELDNETEEGTAKAEDDECKFDRKKHTFQHNDDDDDDIDLICKEDVDFNYCGDPYVKKINGDIKNLSMLRDELRERRLLLANLGSKATNLAHDLELTPLTPSQQHQNSPPTTIQELEEDDSPPLSAKIQSHLSQNSNLISSIGTPQSAKKQQQKINDFILEENEENEEEDGDEDSSSRSRISFSLSYNACNNNYNSTHDTALLLQEDSFEENDTSSMGLQQMKQNLLKTIKYPSSKLNDSNNNSNTNSCDSWANSNTASLDSPSAVGGSATHHVFHHVFREGELDALINKHIGNLHIVSSYYERASWCVVCEKVQVWTI